MQNELQPADEGRGFFRPRNFFLFFLLFTLVVLTAVPSLLYRALPLDTVEAVVWGQEFSLGNCKHPPLSGWLAYGFSSLFGFRDVAMYLLSQILVVIGYVCVYRLGREFFSPAKSVVATCLLSFLLFYCFDSAKYNVNIVSLALWPATALFYWRACSSGRVRDWLLLGLAAGLCVICKLVGLMLLFLLFLHMLSVARFRRRLATPGPYLAALVGLLVVSPYLWWLVDYDFLPFRYLSIRVAEEDERFYQALLDAISGASPLAAEAVDRVLNVICLFVEFLFWIPLIALIWLLASGTVFQARKSRTEGFALPAPESSARDAAIFSAFLTFGPVAIFLLLAAFGSKIDPMWGYPIYFASGIFVMSLWNAGISRGAFVRFAVLVVVFAVGVQLFDVGYFLFKTREKGGHLSGREFALKLDEYCRVRNGGDPIPVVVGEMYCASLTQHYLPYRPTACVFDDPYDRIRFGGIMWERGALATFPNWKDSAVFATMCGWRQEGDADAGERLFFVSPEGTRIPVDLVVCRYGSRYGKKSVKRSYTASIPPKTMRFLPEEDLKSVEAFAGK